MLSCGWRPLSGHGLDRGTVAQHPHATLIANKLQVWLRLQAPAFLLAIKFLEHHGSSGRNARNNRLRWDRKAWPQKRLFGGGANQAVLQPDFDTSFGKQFVGKKGETLGHLRQNSVARMNQYATRLFVSNPREVPLHLIDKVAHFSGNFDA